MSRPLPPWIRTLCAIPLVALAAFVRVMLIHGLGEHSPFLPFFPAVMVAALVGGGAGGMLATVMSAALVAYFWLTPVRSLVALDANDLSSLLVFTISCAMVTAITTALRRAQARAKDAGAAQARLAAELADANRELEAFNYTVAHDLRRPLTNINGYLQVILELGRERLDEQMKGYVREAYDSTLGMNQLIETLLELSRLSGVALNRETVDLSDMARLVAAELELTDPDRRVTFRIADGMTANADARLLRIVLGNLFDNAWKYTATVADAVIECGVTEMEGRTVWFVRDNGPGFPPEEAEKIFRPFHRLTGALACKGYGIGLATVERIVRRHGGTAWARGEPGVGATVFFTLSPGR